MTVSSRTPEGTPSRCPLCGHATNIEFSQPIEDATFPNCGCLVWRAAEILDRIRDRLLELGIARGVSVTADTPLHKLAKDSLDAVELIMELEEAFDFSLPDEEAEQILTVGDYIRYLERRREHS